MKPTAAYTTIVIRMSTMMRIGGRFPDFPEGVVTVVGLESAFGTPERSVGGLEGVVAELALSTVTLGVIGVTAGRGELESELVGDSMDGKGSLEVKSTGLVAVVSSLAASMFDAMFSREVGFVE